MEWSESELGFYPGTRYYRDDWYPHDGPITWEPHQRKVFRYLFTPDKKGRFKISTLWWIDVAKSGKTMLGAALAQYFATYMDMGIKGDVILAANSRTQASERAFAVMKASIERNPHKDEIVDVINNTEIHFIETDHTALNVPRNAGTTSGSNAVFIGHDEVWDLVGNEAKQFAAEMKKSSTRNVSFKLYHSYPGYYGDDGPLAHAIAKFFNEDGSPREGTEQPIPGLPLYVRKHEAFWWNHNPKLYPWHTDEKLDEQREDYRAMPNEYRRIFEAQVVQSEDTFIPASKWYANTDQTWTGFRGDDRGLPIVIGFDLGWKADSCGVVVRGFDTETRRLPLYAYKNWDPSDYRDGSNGYILKDVEQYILDLHRDHHVIAVYYDETQAVYMSNNLEMAGLNLVAVGQVKEREKADTDYKHAIFDGKLRNYRAAGLLSDHVLNAICTYTGHGTLRIRKDKTSKRIDLAVADSMCCYGVMQRLYEFEAFSRRRTAPAYKRILNPFAEIYGTRR